MDIDNMLKREPIKRITRLVPSESLIVILPRTLHLRTYRFSLRPVYTVCFTEVDGPSKRGGEEGATSQHNKPHQRNWLWSWICWTFNQSSTMRFQTLWKGPPHPPSSLLLCAWSPIQRKMVGIYLLALNTWIEFPFGARISPGHWFRLKSIASPSRQSCCCGQLKSISILTPSAPGLNKVISAVLSVNARSIDDPFCSQIFSFTCFHLFPLCPLPPPQVLGSDAGRLHSLEDK